MSRSLTEWLELLEQRHPVSIDMGLERCGEVYQRMGSPRPAPTVITVAGTNGKGSAVAWCVGLLSAMGQRTSAYTSPHILRFNERLQIDRKDVADEGWIEGFEAVEAARGETSLTYFEFTTLAALWLSNRSDVDVAALEVGLGGRLDTVNLVDADLALVMPVDLDHQSWLGEDRETIGREKAGILRAGQPVVLAEAEPPESVLARAGELNCRVIAAGADFRVQHADGRHNFVWDEFELEYPELPLPGEHQFENLAAALAAILTLFPSAASQPEALLDGIGNSRLPGRLQPSKRDPRVIWDVGHNPQAAGAVARWLGDRNPEQVHIVLGMLADKDAGAFSGRLAERAGHWYCAGLPGNRGQDAEALAARLDNRIHPENVSCYATVSDALEAARLTARDTDTILVLGSFETVSRGMRALECD